MRILKLLSGSPYWLISTITALAGLAMVILAVLNFPLLLRIALGLIGLVFVLAGLVLVKQAQREKRDEERFTQIMAKLDELQQELREKQPKKSGAAIVDIISSSIKYYTDNIAKQNREE